MKHTKITWIGLSAIVVLFVGGLPGYRIARARTLAYEKADVNRSFHNAYVDLSRASQILGSSSSYSPLDTGAVIAVQRNIAQAIGLMNGVAGESQDVTGIPRNRFGLDPDFLNRDKRNAYTYKRK